VGVRDKRRGEIKFPADRQGERNFREPVTRSRACKKEKNGEPEKQIRRLNFQFWPLRHG
jgi:hypothetical protein